MSHNMAAWIVSAPTRMIGNMGEGDEGAAYLFELLVAARRLAVVRRHMFLAYLIGMAAEEARLLTEGRSAVGLRIRRPEGG